MKTERSLSEKEHTILDEQLDLIEKRFKKQTKK
jgi:hypothetical protein